MRFVFVSHSVLSDWNHGNAHVLRGVVTELQARGHDVVVCEPAGGWSATNLVAEQGEAAFEAVRMAYPGLQVIRYRRGAEVDRAIARADVVIVHEWNAPGLVRRIGRHPARRRFVLLFHDTHHRAVSAPEAMRQFDLRRYDGVLAFGDVLRRRYLAEGWTRRAWVWHEAADTRVFAPRPGVVREFDVVWIGNWGDEERTAELRTFLIDPVRDLGLRATVYGVRYPSEALDRLAAAGIVYGGWLPNYRVPDVFARHRVTVHVPRRPYVRQLPGIPTIRPFEALACGIPLVSASWSDREGLFRPGDFQVAHDGAGMRRLLARLVADTAHAGAIGARGRETVLARHTCAHRVDELLEIVSEVRGFRPVARLRVPGARVVAMPPGVRTA
jgi:spore maturation protein CgeB